MKVIRHTKQFEKDIKRMRKSGKKIDKLKDAMRLIASEEQMPIKYKNHQLSGEFEDCMECHIEPDWLLVYKIFPNHILFERTGTHSQLFE